MKVTSFFLTLLTLISFSSYAGVGAIDILLNTDVYPLHINDISLDESVNTRQITPSVNRVDFSTVRPTHKKLHLFEYSDYQFLLKHSRKLTHITLIYAQEGNPNLKILMVPTKPDGQTETGNDDKGNKQQETNRTGQSNNNAGSQTAGGSGTGGSDKDDNDGNGDGDRDPSKKRTTSSTAEADRNIGFFRRIYAFFNFMMINWAISNTAHSVAQEVPDNQLTQWMSQNQLLTATGFSLVGISAGFGISSAVGQWTLSQGAHDSVVVGSSIGAVNWYSPQVYAFLSQNSHYVLLWICGYNFGHHFSRHLKDRFDSKYENENENENK